MVCIVPPIPPALCYTWHKRQLTHCQISPVDTRTSALIMCLLHKPIAHVGQSHCLFKSVHDQRGCGSSCTCSSTVRPFQYTLSSCTTCMSCIRSDAACDIPPQISSRGLAVPLRSKHVLHPHSPHRSCRPCAQPPLTWTACTSPCPRSAPRTVRRCPWSTRTPGST